MLARASFEKAGIAHGGGPHHNCVSARSEPEVHRVGGPDPAGNLDLEVLPPQDRLDDLLVVSRAACGVQVNHVKVLGSGLCKLARNRVGIV
jgi:hypothetical protein